MQTLWALNDLGSGASGASVEPVEPIVFFAQVRQAPACSLWSKE